MNMSSSRRYFTTPYVPLTLSLQNTKYVLLNIIIIKQRRINSNKPSITRITYRLILLLPNRLGMIPIITYLTLICNNSKFLANFKCRLTFSRFIHSRHRHHKKGVENQSTKLNTNAKYNKPIQSQTNSGSIL